MKTSILLALASLTSACSAPFYEGGDPPQVEGGSTSTEPLDVGDGGTPLRTDGARVEREAAGDGGPGEAEAGSGSAEAQPSEASEEAQAPLDGSYADVAALDVGDPNDGAPSLNFHCVVPNVGFVACNSGGGWTVQFTAPGGAAETCNVTHPATVGCAVGTVCSFYQQAGTPYVGTCQ